MHFNFDIWDIFWAIFWGGVIISICNDSLLSIVRRWREEFSGVDEEAAWYPRELERAKKEIKLLVKERDSYRENLKKSNEEASELRGVNNYLRDVIDQKDVEIKTIKAASR